MNAVSTTLFLFAGLALFLSIIMAIDSVLPAHNRMIYEKGESSLRAYTLIVICLILSLFGSSHYERNKKTNELDAPIEQKADTTSVCVCPNVLDASP